MSNLKCPFCNQKLEPIGTSGQFQCGTWGCDASFNFIATRDVWEYIDRTRKALDVAVDALKLMYQGNGDPQDIMRYIDNRWTPVRRLCKQTLEQITALEQKD